MGDPYFNRTLIHECDVAAPTQTRDGGEVQIGYGTPQTIACRFSAFVERWSNESASRQIYREHNLMVKPDAPIDRRYRVENVRDASDGTVIAAGPFIVTEVLVASDGHSVHHKQVEMERSD